MNITARLNAVKQLKARAIISRKAGQLTHAKEVFQLADQIEKSIVRVTRKENADNSLQILPGSK